MVSEASWGCRVDLWCQETLLIENFSQVAATGFYSPHKEVTCVTFFTQRGDMCNIFQCMIHRGAESSIDAVEKILYKTLTSENYQMLSKKDVSLEVCLIVDWLKSRLRNGILGKVHILVFCGVSKSPCSNAYISFFKHIVQL